MKNKKSVGPHRIHQLITLNIKKTVIINLSKKRFLVSVAFCSVDMLQNVVYGNNTIVMQSYK